MRHGESECDEGWKQIWKPVSLGSRPDSRHNPTDLVGAGNLGTLEGIESKMHLTTRPQMRHMLTKGSNELPGSAVIKGDQLGSVESRAIDCGGGLEVDESSNKSLKNLRSNCALRSRWKMLGTDKVEVTWQY